MNKEQVKAATLETLRKVEPAEQLPAFIRALKVRTLWELISGGITKETADSVLEAVEEFEAVTE